MRNKQMKYIIDSWLYKCIKQKMGANKSVQTVIDPTLYAELVDQTKQCSVYRNKYGQQFEKYRVENYGIPDFQERYQYRMKSNQDYFVKAYYAGAVEDAFGCSSSNIYDIVIQKIQHRLSDLVNINSEESINIVNGSLKGFKQIFKSMGLLLIKDSMIGINQQNNIKVWINPRFELNTIESQPLSYKNIPSPQQQNVMVGNIFQLVNIRARKQPLWLRYCAQKQMIGVMGFDEAINFTQKFSASNGIRLRNFGIRSEFESDYTSKSVLGQSRMMRSHSVTEKTVNRFQKGNYLDSSMRKMDVEKQKFGESKTQPYNPNIGDPRQLGFGQIPGQYPANFQNISNMTARPTFAHLRTRAINNTNSPNNKINEGSMNNSIPTISRPLHAIQGSVPSQQYQHQFYQNSNVNMNSNPKLDNSLHRPLPQYPPPHLNLTNKVNTHFSYNMPSSINPQPQPLYNGRPPQNTGNNASLGAPSIQKSISLWHINAPPAHRNIPGPNQTSMAVNPNYNKNNVNFSTSIGSQVKKIIDTTVNAEKKLTQQDSHIKQIRIQRQLPNAQPSHKTGQIRSAPSPQAVMIRQEINRVPSQKLIESEKLARSRQPGKIKHKQKANEQDPESKEDQKDSNNKNTLISQLKNQPVPKVDTRLGQQRAQQNANRQTQVRERESEKQFHRANENAIKQKVLILQNKPQENTVANSLIKKQSEPVSDNPLIVISSQKNQKTNVKVEEKVKKIQSFEQSKQQDNSNLHDNSGWATQRFKNRYQHLQNRLSNSVRGASIVMASDNRMQSSKISRASSSDLKSSISYRDLRNLLRSVQRKQK